MADNDKTRTEIVTENIETVENTYGPEEYLRIITTCAKDISVSLAMLVDAGAGSAE